MRPVKAEFLLIVSGTRYNFFYPCQSLSKRVPRPRCLEPDNISLMRPVKAEFLLLCLLTPLSALQDTVRKAWFPIAAWVQVTGDKAVAAVDGLEKSGLPVKLPFWKCIEGLIPPDFEEVTQYMGSSNVSLPMITKKEKQLKAARLWEHHLCHPDNALVDPSRKTLADRARGEQSLLSKTHVTFKTYNWKWSEKSCWPPWKYVVTAAIWSDPTYAPLREALNRPLVNPEVKIAADVHFITVNIGSEAPEAGVTDSKSLDGVMHITGMASGTPLHSTVANMPYYLIIVEVPKGHMEGIHSVVSRNLVSGTLVFIVGSACDVVGVLDGLGKVHDNQGLTTTCVACFFLGSLTRSTRWDSLSYGLFPKIRYPRRYCCLLLLPAACYHSHVGCTVES